ncbi:hypothetical protein [Noviherbaspirillum sp.]|uniref:hypothetical protein n=1 Tax=Noviherbaspirillum sp. TaxID=1926288 RepID=UPI002D6152D0|nr:hypothetical protein [Noviherbaspirillum sp.]HZW20241.1 hypothetical protein [Noviherbaspirillum sp.]
MSKPVFTIRQFCEDHDLSKAFFYKLVRNGLGPKVLKVGRRSMVTTEAAAEWRAAMQERSGKKEGE